MTRFIRERLKVFWSERKPGQVILNDAKEARRDRPYTIIFPAGIFLTGFVKPSFIIAGIVEYSADNGLPISNLLYKTEKNLSDGKRYKKFFDPFSKNFY